MSLTNFKWTRKMNRHFTKEINVANRHIKKMFTYIKNQSSISLIE